jgi:hypothetical protein
MIRMRRILPLVPVLVLAFASNLWAQAQGAPADGAWLTPAAAVILGAFVIAVSVKKAKRDHRD